MDEKSRKFENQDMYSNIFTHILNIYIIFIILHMHVSFDRIFFINIFIYFMSIEKKYLIKLNVHAKMK